jgi:hypothetical protein
MGFRNVLLQYQNFNKQTKITNKQTYKNQTNKPKTENKLQTNK